MLDSDNTSQTDTTDPSGAAPARAPRSRAPKIRISALAKELGIASRDVVIRLTELGETVKSASSSVDEDVAARLRQAYAGTAVSAPSGEAVGRRKTGRSAPAVGRAKAGGSTPAAARAKTGRSGPAESIEQVAPAESVEQVAPAESVEQAAPAESVEQAALEQPAAASAPPVMVFVAPVDTVAPTRRRRAAKAPAGPPPLAEPIPAEADITVAEDAEDQTAEPEDVREAAAEEATGARRRRRRGRRGRGGGSPKPDDSTADADSGDEADDGEREGAAGDVDQPADQPADEISDDAAEATDDADSDEAAGTRRRRRRRRSGNGDGNGSEDDPPNTVTHVREVREAREAKNAARKSENARADDDDGVKGVKGSTRLEARRQRRRDGRETTRRRPPILTESEFLARREAVERVMAVRQTGDRIQIAVLEDDVLVEHYVTRERATSYVGNVYLGRVQNVLPSMEAAFIDIGKGRNGVLYAGEVNWDAAGLEGKSRAIEHALKSGDSVLVQVTKDPIGHKGARLTSQVSLPGRFLVYVPGGGMTGISRRLPDTERHRLKSILKKIIPEDAGVIVRTAAEGATEADLTRDVDRLKAEWDKIAKKSEKTSSGPTLVHGEPDLAIRVVRDVFNEDFTRLVVQGDDAWKTVSDYVEGVAPDLGERVSRHTADTDIFHDLRVDEQLMKALDRKVWLPSGGSLVIDRTEAMTVVDVNTGKFVGSGGNLEQTVTRNNLEAAEEIVRQLRLRDVGGIVVIDFIDMVLESNRELVLRRLTECLGRDRTKHQVAEVTSLGLVQMTRKRVGEGLLEAFSETCPTCHGRGLIVHTEPVDQSQSSDTADDSERSPGKQARRKRATSKPEVELDEDPALSAEQRQKALAAMAAIHRAAHPEEYSAEGAAAEPDVDAVAAVLAGSPVDILLDAVSDDLAGGLGVTDDAANDGDDDVAPPEALTQLVPPEPVHEGEPGPEAESVPEGEPLPEAEPVPEGEPLPEAEPDRKPVRAEQVPEAEPMPEPDHVASPPSTAVRSRPRGRRAATRPAGPPAAV